MHRLGEGLGVGDRAAPGGRRGGKGLAARRGHQRAGGLELGLRQRRGPVDGVLHLALRLRRQLAIAGLVEQARLGRAVAQAQDGIDVAPLRLFVLAAVALQVGAHGMVVPAIGQGLDQARSLARPRPQRGAQHRVVDRRGVVAVDPAARQVVGRGAAGDAAAGDHAVAGRRQAVEVVLAEEDQRQPPDRRQVHGLVEDALAGRAVAEEGDADRARAAQLLGQGGAGAESHAGTDDAVRAQDAALEVRDVHRAAEAVAVALGLAHQLGHHPAQFGALGDGVPVAAVVGQDEVLGLQRLAGAGGDGFLADRGMRRALDPAFEEELLGPPLELADAQHGGQHGDQVLARQGVGGRDRLGRLEDLDRGHRSHP